MEFLLVFGIIGFIAVVGGYLMCRYDDLKFKKIIEEAEEAHRQQMDKEMAHLKIKTNKADIEKEIEAIDNVLSSFKIKIKE